MLCSPGAQAIFDGGDEAIWGQRFRAVLITNRAAARARQHHWIDALGDCHLALRLYPSYLKAVKRRGDLYQVRVANPVAQRSRFLPDLPSRRHSASTMRLQPTLKQSLMLTLALGKIVPWQALRDLLGVPQ